MKKEIHYEIVISDFREIIFFKEDYDDCKLIRFTKSGLRKKNIDYLKITETKFQQEKRYCPFCGSDSKKEIVFNIDRVQKIIYINGISYFKNSEGKINLHCKGGKKQCPGSLLNPNSKKYLSLAYDITEEEAKKYLIERSKSPFYSSNHSSLEDYKKYQSRNKEWYIQEYGQEKGEEKFNSFSQKMKIKSSKSYLSSKYGKEYSDEVSKKKSQTLPNFIKRYGELEGIKKWEIYKKSIVLKKEDFIKKHGESRWEELSQKRIFKKTLEYHIEIYGLEIGTKKYLDLISSYSFTKEDCIKKYGIEKWKERSIKLNKFKGYSKESCRFFEILLEKFKEDNLDIKFLKWKDDEFFLWDDEYRRIYFYDFYFEINGNRFIIEYDNSFWHPQNEFNINFINSGLSSNMSVQEKIEYDDRKSNWAKFKGIEIIHIYFNSDKNPLRFPSIWKSFLDLCLEKIKLNVK
jgi:hypothetical protein